MNNPIYCQAFAEQAPIMRARYVRATTTQCHWAKLDVWTALKNAEAFSPAYVAKLYAELDAIRDRELELSRKAKVAA